MRTTIGAAKRLFVRQRIDTAVVQLLRGWVGVLQKLNLGNGCEATQRHPDSPADNAFLRRLVSNTRAGPNFSCNPSVAPCSRPLDPRPHQHDQLGLAASSTSSVRRIAVSMLMRVAWALRRLQQGCVTPSANT